MQAVCYSCGQDKTLLDVSRSLAGKKKTVFLCIDCAHVLGIRDEEMMIPMNPADLFERLIDPEGSSQRDQSLCPACGTGFVRIRHSGMAGCVQCFETFHTEIERLLPRLARRTVHTGSLPGRIQFFRRLFVNKADLKERLEAALHAEDYESAARLRDALGENGQD